MRHFLAPIAFFALLGCGPASQATATASPTEAVDGAQGDVFGVKVERRQVAPGFVLKSPSESEKAHEISNLEAEFQKYMESDQTVHATYRYLNSGNDTLIEKIAYMDAGPRYGNKSGPIYAHYIGMNGGKVVSILCMPHEPIARVSVALSNCAREVGAALGPGYLALIRSGAGGE